MTKRKERVRVREDGHFYVTIQLTNRWEIGRLSTILSAAADHPSCTQKESARWHRVAAELKWSVEKARYHVSGRVIRPPGDHVNETDMLHVLRGGPPYPVLSKKDMLTVLPQLAARRLRPEEIAERVHVSVRTVFRYLEKIREGKPL